MPVEAPNDALNFIGPRLMAQVYVILFGVGSTDTEGIYSLRVMSREEGLPQDTIIAFSTKEDAER